jgi:hypothetical protein
MGQEIEVVSETHTGQIQRAAELSVEEIVSRVSKVQEVQRRVMRDGVHYGKVPSVDKPTLLKPGAEILGMVFCLDPQFEVTELRDGDHLTVNVKCIVYHQGSGARLGSGLGSCSTKESRYAWRKGGRKCPACSKEGTIIKGKAEFGGGWLCFGKKGGCGQKFADGDPAIESQQTDRVPNPDLYDVHNTVLKMAIKRAHVAAILFVTCASEIFTQDVEDMGFAEPEPPVQRGDYRDREDRQPRRDPINIEPSLSAYANAKTFGHVEQADGVVALLKDSLSDPQLKMLRRAHTEARKRIEREQEEWFAANGNDNSETERAMG